MVFIPVWQSARKKWCMISSQSKCRCLNSTYTQWLWVSYLATMKPWFNMFYFHPQFSVSPCLHDSIVLLSQTVYCVDSVSWVITPQSNPPPSLYAPRGLGSIVKLASLVSWPSVLKGDWTTAVCFALLAFSVCCLVCVLLCIFTRATLC